MSNPISINLRRLRKKLALTQEQLAVKADISRNAYRSIETGASEPRSSTLSAIAKVLGVSVFDLVAEVPSFQALRFRSAKSLTAPQKAELEQMKIEIATQLTDFNEIEKMAGNHIEYKFRNVQFAPNPKDAAHQARQKLGLKVKQCVPDICNLLEIAGIKVLLLDSNLKSFFGLSVGLADGGPAIVVNIEASIPVERRIFTAAHELGHLLLHSDSYNGNEVGEEKHQEKEANIFASYFLMPQVNFQEVWREGSGLPWVDSVLHTKRRFHVSYKTVLMRLVDEGLTDKRIYRKFAKEYELRHNKKLTFKEEPESYVSSSDEPNRLDIIDFIEDRLSRLVRQALEDELISISRAAEILNINTGEMRKMVGEWKMFT